MGVESWRTASRRVWGWSVYLEVVDPTEGPALRQAADEVIAGRSVFAIAKEWNANPRLHTVPGGPWSGLVIAKILTRRTNEQGPEPLLTHSTYAAVCHVLGRRRVDVIAERRATEPALDVRPTARRTRAQAAHPVHRRSAWEEIGRGRWVATDVVRCGVCGSATKTRGRTARGETRLACRITGTNDPAGGNHPTVALPAAEAAVVTAAVEAWARATGRTTGAARTEFEAMNLRERRDIANETLTAVIERQPRSKQLGLLRIERRAS